jgi:TonB family protein
MTGPLRGAALAATLMVAGCGSTAPQATETAQNAARELPLANTAGSSRDTGGGGLAGRSTTRVAGVAGGGGGGAGGTLLRAGNGTASRSIAEIKLVFERNKGAIHAIDKRALRGDPAPRGTVVLELTIAPSGEVLACRLASSELNSAERERKLLARIRRFEFGAKEVEQMVVDWPVDFVLS